MFQEVDHMSWIIIILSLSVLKDLVLIPVHTKPKDSQKELDELYDVFLHVKDKWKTDVSLPLSNHNTFQRKSIVLFVLHLYSFLSIYFPWGPSLGNKAYLSIMALKKFPFPSDKSKVIVFGPSKTRTQNILNLEFLKFCYFIPSAKSGCGNRQRLEIWQTNQLCSGL